MRYIVRHMCSGTELETKRFACRHF